MNPYPIPNEAIRDVAIRSALDKNSEVLKELQKRHYNLGSVLAGNVQPASFEAAMTNELLRRSGRMQGDPRNHEVPVDIFTRNLNVTGGTANQGANLVETEVLPDIARYVGALRATSVIMGAGATMLYSVEGDNLKIARVYAPPSAGSGETATVSVVVTNPSGLRFEQFSLTATHYSTQFAVSNQVLAQASDRKINDFLVSECAKSISKLIDWLCINGTGNPGVNEALKSALERGEIQFEKLG